METLSSGSSRFAVLTARECDVAEYLIRGLSNRKIAVLLSIKIKTVDTHRGHLLKKLGVRNNVELTLLALRDGFLHLDGPSLTELGQQARSADTNCQAHQELTELLTALDQERNAHQVTMLELEILRTAASSENALKNLRRSDAAGGRKALQVTIKGVGPLTYILGHVLTPFDEECLKCAICAVHDDDLFVFQFGCEKLRLCRSHLVMFGVSVTRCATSRQPGPTATSARAPVSVKLQESNKK